MDTTLRDGEQTSGVGFSASEKFTIAKLLIEELKVDRIEVASARVSKGELEAVQKITHWASQVGHLSQIEVLTFVDGGLATGCWGKGAKFAYQRFFKPFDAPVEKKNRNSTLKILQIPYKKPKNWELPRIFIWKIGAMA